MAYLRLACSLFLMSTVAAQATNDPTDLPNRPMPSPTLVEQVFAYDPSKVAAGIFAGLYGITAFIIYLRLFANRAWWGLCLPIAAAFMSAGFVLRIILTLYPNSLSIYICSELFILLSPTAFLAFNYILYGRFAIECIERCHSLIRPERTARYFIFSDFATFLIQGTGGSLLTSSDPNILRISNYIVLPGLILQTVSFVFFILLVYGAFRSLKRAGVKPFKTSWGMIFKLLFFTSAFFLLRCVYRTIELGENLGDGYLTDHEAFFYIFDALPLLIGITAYEIFWPSRYLRPSFDTPSSDEINALDLPKTREDA